MDTEAIISFFFLFRYRSFYTLKTMIESHIKQQARKRLDDPEIASVLARFPARRFTGNTSDAVVAARTVALNTFLHEMLQRTALYPEVCDFPPSGPP